jgi:hypothetical protein
MTVRRFVARITPQRSTQYTDMARTLARPELMVSPLASLVQSAKEVTLAGQPYLHVALREEPGQWPIFATLSEWHEFFPELGGEQGPFLRPLEPRSSLLFGDDLVEARRYRGKTNELFTHFLINVARWSHGGDPRWLLDPLAGGGTTLFMGLRLGMNVMGVEKDRQTLTSTDTFLKEYVKTARLKHSREQQKRQAGYRFRYLLPDELQLVLALGDTSDTSELLGALPGAPRPDLVVADLPYAIQHSARGPLRDLLQRALPAWHEFAAPGAVLAFSWNATTVAREQILGWLAESNWKPMADAPYDEMAHRVDRVIKTRDVAVARK